MWKFLAIPQDDDTFYDVLDLRYSRTYGVMHLTLNDRLSL